MRKEKIPNILTITRISITPIIIILGLFKKWPIVIILSLIGAITDCLDGKLARKFNAQTSLGATLDAIADKVFAFALIASLISINKSLVYLLIGELLLAITNTFYHYTNEDFKTLIVGKFKTTLLFLTIISSYLSILNIKFLPIVSGFSLATFNLQLVCIFEYFCSYYNLRFLKNVKIDEKIESSNLIDLAEKYGTLDETKSSEF